jgi:hypothetical protein
VPEFGSPLVTPHAVVTGVFVGVGGDTHPQARMSGLVGEGKVSQSCPAGQAPPHAPESLNPHAIMVGVAVDAAVGVSVGVDVGGEVGVSVGAGVTSQGKWELPVIF